MPAWISRAFALYIICFFVCFLTISKSVFLEMLRTPVRQYSEVLDVKRMLRKSVMSERKMLKKTVREVESESEVVFGVGAEEMEKERNQKGKDRERKEDRGEQEEWGEEGEEEEEEEGTRGESREERESMVLQSHILSGFNKINIGFYKSSRSRWFTSCVIVGLVLSVTLCGAVRR